MAGGIRRKQKAACRCSIDAERQQSTPKLNQRYSATPARWRLGPEISKIRPISHSCSSLVTRPFFPAILICFAMAFIAPSTAHPWGSEHLNDPNHADSAHYFILHKAVEHIREEGLLPGWPLETYLADLQHGAQWADFPYYPVGLECDWGGFYLGTCDALHHYLSGEDCIHLTDAGVCIGDGGGLGAPQAAKKIYDLAVRFWPGRSPVPDIHALELRETGGYMTTLFDGEDLGPFLVGGHPFAFDILCEKVISSCPPGEWCFCFEEDAYRWPGFVGKEAGFTTKEQFFSEDYRQLAPAESYRISLIYLGWAIHYVEDLSTPVHAQNLTGTYHKEFEDRADQLIHSGAMSHLPVSSDEEYSFVSTIFNNYPVSPDFFSNDWDISQFAREAALRAVAAQHPPGMEEWWMHLDDQIEIDLDTSIKLVAGVLNKFFSEVRFPDKLLPENPNLQSQTHAKGQPSCEQYLTVEWEMPESYWGVAGYSYALVSADAPDYDEKRIPDELIDLDASVISFTTPSLELGHGWEFNIRTIDTAGLASKFYESFWVQIEACSVGVRLPRAGDVVEVMQWPLVCWGQVTWGGNDVAAGYDVGSINLYKGADLVMNLWSDYPNLGCMAWMVPDVVDGSNYRIGVILERNSTGDFLTELPERLIGFSGYFTIQVIDPSPPVGGPVAPPMPPSLSVE